MATEIYFRLSKTVEYHDLNGFNSVVTYHKNMDSGDRNPTVHICPIIWL